MNLLVEDGLDADEGPFKLQLQGPSGRQHREGKKSKKKVKALELNWVIINL